MSETSKVRRIPASQKSQFLLKAGIYLRVSTSRVEQLRSLSNQVSAMTRYVYSMPNWNLKDIYLEVGSAKTGESRREFTRLAKDCKEHKIEVVVVKSLSRFGRDNVEVIESIRTLVNAGVTIYFMEEDIDVDTGYSEWELSIRSAINQAENEHRSENIKMGLRFRAESGKSGLYRKPCYGYKKNDQGGSWSAIPFRQQWFSTFMRCIWKEKVSAALSKRLLKSRYHHQKAANGGASVPSKQCLPTSNTLVMSKC